MCIYIYIYICVLPHIELAEAVERAGERALVADKWGQP